MFGDLHVSSKVKTACHAVAIHERRMAFTPNLMNARDGVFEVWFKGNHADIGGGYSETGLSDISLEWMVSLAKDAGLEFDSIVTHPDADMIPHHEEGMLRYEERRIGVKADDEWSAASACIHETAADMPRRESA